MLIQKGAWICCECLHRNQVSRLLCVRCGKQRWDQLGIPLPTAITLLQDTEGVIAKDVRHADS